MSNPQVPESDQDKKLPNGILLNNTTTDRINSRKESLESIETVDTVDLELIKLGPELLMGFLEKVIHKLQDKKPKVGSRGVLFKCQPPVVPICWAGRPELEVCLPFSRLLTGIQMLPVF